MFYDKQMGDDELEATEEIQMGNDADGKSVVTGGHGGQQVEDLLGDRTGMQNAKEGSQR